MLETELREPQNGQSYQSSVFVVTEWVGALSKGSDEHEAIAWFTVEAMRALGASALRDYAHFFHAAQASRSPNQPPGFSQLAVSVWPVSSSVARLRAPPR